MGNFQTKTYNYGRQSITEEDIAAVAEVLRGHYITSGPHVLAFEQAICQYTGAKYCVVVSSATAALHLAMLVMKLKPEDEVITSTMSFLASSNCVLYAGAKPKFADIEPDTANMDPADLEKRITKNTRGIIPVHFAGQSCDMEKIRAVADKHNLFIVEDASHAIGSDYKGQKVGSCKYSDMTVFSFHPVKTVTSGEGGAITTNSPELYEHLLHMRSHGTYPRRNWIYDMEELGYNYRLTDIQAALGESQLKRLDAFKKRRREIVDFYNLELNLPHLAERDYSNACFHLYPVLIEDRDRFYVAAKEKGMILQVHYRPIHTQPYYQKLGFKAGDFPNAENYYSRAVSLPVYPALDDGDLKEILRRIKEIL